MPTRLVIRAGCYALVALAALASLVVGAGLASAPPASANLAHVPILSISPHQANFGSLFVGQTSDPTVFTVRNSGTVASQTLTATVTELTRPQDAFGIVQDSCTGNALRAFSSCSVSVVFHPHGQGGLAIGRLDVVPVLGCCPPGVEALFAGTGHVLTEVSPPPPS